MKQIIAFLLAAYSCYAQIVYEPEFLSAGNEIELETFNKTSQSKQGIIIRAEAAAEWIRIEPGEVEIPEIRSNSGLSTVFQFSLGEKAVPGREEKIILKVYEQGRLSKEKEITIKVLPPKEYTLRQNYPNPFNPGTKIGFSLPVKSKASLKIYDILGREFDALSSRELEAGYHEIEFNAGAMASGVYFYRIEAEGEAGKKFVQTKKMMILK